MLRSSWAWGAIVAWGAGLVQLALGASALTSPDAGVAFRGTGIGLLASGALAFAWGVGCLLRGRIVATRLTAAGAVAGGAIVLLAFVLDPARIGVLPTAVTILFLMIVAILAVAARRRSAHPRWARNGAIGVVVGAFLVGAVVTPTLAATTISQLGTEQADVVFDSIHAH